MYKIIFTSILAVVFFVGLSIAMTDSPCVEIYKFCEENNPFDPTENLHSFQAHIGYMNGCLNFLEACFEQN